MTVYLKLIWAYLKIGLFGFGGGYAMLALIEREVVAPGWITKQMFTDIVAISQMTPGPIGINSATYIGYVVTGSVLGSSGRCYKAYHHRSKTCEYAFYHGRLTMTPYIVAGIKDKQKGVY